MHQLHFFYATTTITNEYVIIPCSMQEINSMNLRLISTSRGIVML